MAKVLPPAHLHLALGKVPLAEVEAPPRACRGHCALPSDGGGLVGPQLGLEVGVDGSHVGGAHRGHGEESVPPAPEPGHALVQVEEAGEGGHHAGLDGEQLAREVPPPLHAPVRGGVEAVVVAGGEVDHPLEEPRAAVRVVKEGGAVAGGVHPSVGAIGSFEAKEVV